MVFSYKNKDLSVNFEIQIVILYRLYRIGLEYILLCFQYYLAHLYNIRISFNLAFFFWKVISLSINLYIVFLDFY